eukprot:g1892.t1
MDSHFSKFSCKVEDLGPNRGRGLVATEQLERGAIVCCTKLYTSILHPKLWDKRCFNCFKKTKSPGFSDASNSVVYCSQGCKDHHCTAQDWEVSHLGSLRAAVKDNTVLSDLLLLGRTLRGNSTDQGKGNADCGETKDVATPTFLDVQNMCFHDSVNNPHHQTIVSRIQGFSKDFLGLGDGAFSADELVQFLQRFGCNNFSVTDKLMVSVAACVSPYGAILNHSCLPNCVVSYRFEKSPRHCVVQQIRTSRPVAPGEELCHPYLDTACSKVDRRTKLLADYGFTCSCSRCSPKDGMPILVRMTAGLVEEVLVARLHMGVPEKDLKLFRAQALTARVDLEACLVGDISSKPVVLNASKANKRRDFELMLAKKLMEEAALEEDAERELKLLLQVQAVRSRYLHPLNLENLIVTNNIFTVALLVHKYDLAFNMAHKSMDVYMSIYCYKHPMIAMKAYTMGSLIAQQQPGGLEMAKHYLSVAIDILSLTHGKDAEIVAEIQAYQSSLMV